jgi:nicotinamidase-related amidase
MAQSAWRDLLSDKDRAVFEASGYGQRLGFGRNPAILVIDVNYNFIGDRPEPILDSIKRYPYSCGQAGWDALPHLGALLGAARTATVPIAYCTGRWTPDNHNLGILGSLNSRHRGELTSEGHRGHYIVPDVAPAPEDIFIEKH